MITTSFTYRRVGVAVGVACLMAAACTKSLTMPTTPTIITIRFDAGEKASSQAVNGFVSAIRAIATVAQAPAGPATLSRASPRAGASGAPSRILAATACASASIRYFNNQGQEQPAYNPATTTRATATGTCATSGGSMIIDLVLDDMLASSPAYLVNGTIQTVYEGKAVNGTLTNVRVPKQGCQSPSSGDMTLHVDQTAIAFHFDGSATLTGIYTIDGHTVTFTVPIAGC